MFKKTARLTALAGLALAGTSASATTVTTVWNVNIGAENINGYQGAATENPVSGSTWNAVTTAASTTLDDSSGDDSAGVTISMTHSVDVAEIYFGTTGDTFGDTLFKSWIKDDNNSDDYSVTFGGLSAAATYDLVVYSGWRFGAAQAPKSDPRVTQSDSEVCPKALKGCHTYNRVAVRAVAVARALLLRS